MAAMMPARAFCHEAVLVRPLGAHAWWLRLPNGHELAGVVRRVDRPVAEGLVAGQVVTVEVAPADFSRGRLRFLDAVGS